MAFWDATHRANHAAATRAAKLTHGLKHTSTYRIWTLMRHRCHNPNSPAWKHYGGRGIVVCERWRTSFEAFVADMGLRPDNLELDRIDNDGPYAPDNCRWVTRTENMRNCRRNVYLEYGGERMTLTQWAKKLGRSHTNLVKRRAAGWSVPEILFGRRAAARLACQ